MELRIRVDEDATNLNLELARGDGVNSLGAIVLIALVGATEACHEEEPDVQRKSPGAL